MNKITAFDVALYFLFLARDHEDILTKLQLQKLLYYAQAYSLHYLKEPLFEEDIQAWKFGPIVPSVFYGLKEYRDIVSFDILENFNTNIFSDDQRIILQSCFRDYGKYSSSYLVKLVYNEESYKNNYKEGCNNIIPLEEITSSLIKQDLKYLSSVKRKMGINNGR